MATARRPKSDNELRLLGVPEEVIEFRRSPHRVHVSTMRGVSVDFTVDDTPHDLDLRRTLGRKIEAARRRFRREN